MAERVPTPRGDPEGAPERHESEAQRLDRNLAELLQELRVIGVGVQVLFAFLLTVAFSSGRTSLTSSTKALYITVLLVTAAAAACLVAPAAHHRLVFRQGRKAELVTLANVLTTVGMGFVAVALSGSIALVAEVVYGGVAAIAVGCAGLVTFGALWFIVPLVLLRSRKAPPVPGRMNA